MKTPARPRRSRPLGAVERLETRELMTLGVTAPLPDMNVATGAASAPVDLDTFFKDPAATPDFAIFDTTLGTIPVLLTPATTPKTVANFLSYVNKGSYTNTIVHRSVPGFIWQSGGYQLTSTPSIAPIQADAPVPNEFGASNVRGTIAMAKLGSDPNSATNEFFFNEANNAANLDRQNGGFTVFGNVVSDAGLAVMDAIAGVPVPSPGPLKSPLDAIPLQNYTAGTAVAPANLILINGVTQASEAFVTSSDKPGVATASIRGSTLIVNPLSAGTAHITVVGYGSDGKAATQTFTVNVAGAPQPSGGGSTSPIVPRSVLTPAVSGPLPASVVASPKGRFRQIVTLTNSSGTVAQEERVALKLSTTTAGSPGDITVAGATTKVRLKPGRRARVNLAARLSPSVPAGTYHVLITVTDPDGAETTVDTGRTLIVRAAP